MESTDVNSPAPFRDDDTRLAELVRQSASALPDDGFSTRVLAALPPPLKTAPASWRRTIACAVGAIAGCAVTVWRGPAWSDAAAWIDRSARVSLPLDAPPLSIALTVAAVSLAFAFRAELRERLLS